MDRKCRFIAFPSVRCGGEVGRVGFDHDAVEWGLDGCLEGVSGFFEGRDARVGEVATESENLLSMFNRPEETVKDGFEVTGKGAVNGDCVGQRLVARFVAGVDDDVFSKLLSESEMLLEEIALALVVIGITEALGRGVEVVEACFSNGAALRVLGGSAQRSEIFIGCLADVAGMDADGGEDCGELLGNGEILRNVLEAGGEGDEAVNALAGGALDELGEFLLAELVRGEVTVGVSEHGVGASEHFAKRGLWGAVAGSSGSAELEGELLDLCCHEGEGVGTGGGEVLFETCFFDE